MKILVLATSLLLIACNLEKSLYQEHAFIDDANAENTMNNLDALIPDLMEKYNIRGLSISILRNSKIAQIKSYGVLNSQTNIPVNNESLFEFASLSKPVFALAVLQLSKDGIIDLDQPLFEYLEYPYAAHDDRYKLITTRMVLGHKTGFPNWGKDGKVIMISTPGTKFGYSGIGYYYLQQVLEKITGKNLQEIIQEQIFRPLNMTHSSFIWENRFQNQVSSGHNSNGEFSRDIRIWENGVSASSLISNISDYSKFVSYLLNEYASGNSTVMEMLEPVSQVKDYNKWGKLQWSLGWGIEETKQGKSIWHWGNNDEFRSLVVANVENGNGFVYVANSSSGLRPISKIIQQAIGGVHPLTKYDKVN